MREYGDHHTADLFDPWHFLGPARRRALERGWAGLFRAEVRPHLPVGRVGAHFAARAGAPTKDLFVVLGVLILQQIHDLTDAQAAEAAAFNLAWQYALDVRRGRDASISERTIRNYRALLVEHGLDEVLFQVLTDRLVRSFKVDPTRQRIDSTALRSAMRHLGRLGTFTQTLGVFLRRLSRAFPDAYAHVDPAVRQRYADGGRAMCFGGAAASSCKPSEASRHLDRAARDLLDLVDRFAGTAAARLEEYALLERLLAEYCEVKGDDGGGDGGRKVTVKDQKDVGGACLQNPSDPDATFNSHKGRGYLMQVMETYTEKADADAAAADTATTATATAATADTTAAPAETTATADAAAAAASEPSKPDLITYVAVHGMTDYDGDALEPALAQTARRGVAPRQLLADTPYGTGDNPARAAARGVELISPAQPGKGAAQGKPQLEDFELDAGGRVTRCPAGHAPVSASNTAKNYQARFDAGVCAACPLRAAGCPVQRPRPTDPAATRLQYDAPRLAMYRRRRGEREAAFTRRYRWRAGIEGTMSRLKHVLGLAALRVRGRAAVRYEAYMGALGLNILRCAAAR